MAPMRKPREESRGARARQRLALWTPLPTPHSIPSLCWQPAGGCRCVVLRRAHAAARRYAGETPPDASHCRGEPQIMAEFQFKPKFHPDGKAPSGRIPLSR
eukprot:120198-Chlamydomonas_euryale.AAC.1